MSTSIMILFQDLAFHYIIFHSILSRTRLHLDSTSIRNTAVPHLAAVSDPS